MLDTIKSLIDNAQREIAAGATGFFYVRQCFSQLSDGWSPKPLEINGLVWSEYSPEKETTK